MRQVTRAYARENQLLDAAGFVVLGAQPGYPAAEAGLARGDIITKVGAESVTTLDGLKKIHAAYEARPEPLLVEAQRNRRISLYVIKP